MPDVDLFRFFGANLSHDHENYGINNLALLFSLKVFHF